MRLDPSQEEAIRHAVRSRFSIVNGGAGTGKTTIIRNINEEMDGTVEICAFAGKAAARLRQLGIEASTIHRMLMYNGSGFMRGSLWGVTVIVDEASMVSSDLMAEIVNRGPKRLVLVGDQAQLPPVGAGQPFHDLITLRPDLVATLDICHRAQEAIYRASAMIREGQVPPDRLRSDEERWTFYPANGDIETHKMVIGMVESGQFDFRKDIILCPKNGTDEDQPAAVKCLNRDIVARLNPRAKEEAWKIGDRVINGKNFAEHDVWNGTTGTIDAIDHAGDIWVELDVPIRDPLAGKTLSGKPVTKTRVLFDRDMKRELSLAYALTVHKSQGSQYRRVVFICLTRDAWSLLDRSLIYTAVTRAQGECIVIGDPSALAGGIGKLNHKDTVIQQLARGAM